MEAPATQCRNCGTALDGLFCRSCGQREGRGDLHFGEALSDVLGEVFTWDSRVWRTLFPLLFRPGFLSAEFNAGRRMRYMPPFRLYIVVSFLMFLVVAFEASDSVTVGAERLDKPSDDQALSIDSDAPLDAGTESHAEPHAGSDPESDSGSDIDINIDADGFTFNLTEGGPWWMQALEQRIEDNAKSVSEDPRDYIATLAEYLPQVMFVMLPLFALLLKFVYLFSPFHYLQHLVFALHYHTFVYLLYLISSVLERVSTEIDGVFALLLIIYLPLALHRAYSSSWLGAVGKSLSLMLSYGVALFLGMATAAVAVLAAM